VLSHVRPVPAWTEVKSSTTLSVPKRLYSRLAVSTCLVPDALSCQVTTGCSGVVLVMRNETADILVAPRRDPALGDGGAAVLLDRDPRGYPYGLSSVTADVTGLEQQPNGQWR
jgi:hypothetical protein